MKIGFGKVDITPRVGVELCGFGAFILRRSIAVRDNLWTRAVAFGDEDKRCVLVSCDLIGISAEITSEVRQRVGDACGIPADAIMVHCTHTHSGPSVISKGKTQLTGWGEADLPYSLLLPKRIAKACIMAVENMTEAELRHAEVPCLGMGLNREYDRDQPPLEEVLDEGWQPEKPELTDTTCHVITAHAGEKMIGFMSYFGCHPVTCCATTRYIHGDYCGVATNLLERENPGSVGLFLQGAQGDVNSCVVHKPEAEALLALDVLASRYARAVRKGVQKAKRIDADNICWTSSKVAFSRKPWNREDIENRLHEEEEKLEADDLRDDTRDARFAAVYITACRRMLTSLDRGETLSPETELQGLRIGPIAFLGSPFEIFQAIKNKVTDKAQAPIPLVMGLTNDLLGYAPDETAAARGGYAADTVPMIIGMLPFANIDCELSDALLKLEGDIST